MKYKTILISMLTIALTACGGKLNGTYVNDQLEPVLTLKPNGKAIYMKTTEMDYEVDGKEVKLHSPQGTLILKMLDDGSIQFPFLGKLKKIPL